MKKSILILLLCLTTITMLAQQAGRVRVLFKGFKCIQETADDILQSDGKANEVFFQFYFTLADKNGTQKLKYSYRSDVYGDNTSPRYNNRIKAGTAVDLFGNMQGGVKSGDNYETTKIIGEYNLAAGDVLTVIPTIWEWNVGIGNEGMFDATLENSTSQINTNAAALSNQRFPKPGQIGNFSTADLTRFIYLDAITALGVKAVLRIVGELTPKSRPVGITKDGTFSPKALLFTGNAMQEIANMNFGYGLGILPVQYNDIALGNDRDHGNYIILLKVEFFPTNTPATSNPPASNPATSNPATSNPPPAKSVPADPVFNRSINSNRTVSAGSVPKQPGTSFTNEFLSGVWKGTIGTLTSATDGPFSFKFNNNVFWVLDKTGASTAAGSYQIVNGAFNAVYYDSNNWKYVITSAGYTSATGEMYGNWTCEGPNYYKTGKWITKKVSN